MPMPICVNLFVQDEDEEDLTQQQQLLTFSVKKNKAKPAQFKTFFPSRCPWKGFHLSKLRRNGLNFQGLMLSFLHSPKNTEEIITAWPCYCSKFSKTDASGANRALACIQVRF